jgi:hypothetical protein
VIQRGKSRKQSISVGLAVATVLALTTPAQAAPSEVPDSVPGFNGTVLTVAYSGNTVYVGGDFTTALVNGARVKRSRLAAVNATTGELLPWAPQADGRVKALVVSGDSVYIGGDFATVGGQQRDSLARLDARDGTLSDTFSHSVEGRPYALTADSGRLYVGGTLTRVDGQDRTRLAAFNLSTGALDTRWRPAVDNQVESLAAGSGRVYVGGRFHKVNSTAGYDRLVALDPVSAKIITGFKPKPPVITFGIAVKSNGVVTAHGGKGGMVASYSLSGGKRWAATFDGDAQAVAVLGGTVFVGGHFDHACRTARTGAQGACMDGSDDRVKFAALAAGDGRLLNWSANGNGVVGVLAMCGSPSLGSFVAGGAFTTIDGRTQKRFVQFS